MRECLQASAMELFEILIGPIRKKIRSQNRHFAC